VQRRLEQAGANAGAEGLALARQLYAEAREKVAGVYVIPPFKRKDTSYTYAFEEHVVRLLIGSTAEDVARRLGISAETVGRIVKYQLQEAKTIDPTRKILDVGMDEISLKKRHKLYVTVLTDLTDPERPRLLAVKPGRDEAAGRACLECLTPEQRAQVHSYRVDMGASFNKACKEGLPNARGVTDRFHVAKLWNETLDGLRKKNGSSAFKRKTRRFRGVSAPAGTSYG